MKKGGAYLRSHGMDEKLLSTNLSAAGLGFFARLAVLVDLLTLPLPHDTVPPHPQCSSNELETLRLWHTHARGLTSKQANYGRAPLGENFDDDSGTHTARLRLRECERAPRKQEHQGHMGKKKLSNYKYATPRLMPQRYGTSLQTAAAAGAHHMHTHARALIRRFIRQPNSATCFAQRQSPPLAGKGCRWLGSRPIQPTSFLVHALGGPSSFTKS